MPQAYVFLADGFEEVEAFTPIDLMVRAGITVQRVGVPAATVQGSSGTTVVADLSISELPEPSQDDILVLPGGSDGASNLVKSETLAQVLKQHNERGGMIAAICIAPVRVLGALGLLAGRQYTCYPGGEEELSDSTASLVNAPVVRDGTIITSRGVGTAAQFAAALIGLLVGKEQAEQVWNSTLQHMSSTHCFHFQ